MARPTRDAIQAYMSITGASEQLALHRLEEHGGNLSQAVDAHFGELERNIVNPTSGASYQNDFVDSSYPSQSRRRGFPSLIAAARAFRPSLLLDPSYRRNLLNQIGGSAFAGRPHPVPHTGEVTGFPVESTSMNNQMHHSGLGVALENARTSPTHGSEIHDNTSRDQRSYSYNADIEDQMIQAAIDASKKDIQEGCLNKKYACTSDPSDDHLSPKEILQQEDEELARALSLSLKTQELEKVMLEQIEEIEHQQLGADDSGERSQTTENSRFKPGSSSAQHRPEDVKQKWPGDDIGHENHLQHIEESPYPMEVLLCYQRFLSFLTSERRKARTLALLHLVYCFCIFNYFFLLLPFLAANKWGGIPSKELDEAIMLETALFSEINNNVSRKRLHETYPEEQSNRIMANEEKLERCSTVKESLLPVEPTLENEDAITLLVKMPDGSRRGRRFLKSDKLLCLFDFIDIGGGVKPGTYRVVRPYPRRAFSVDEGALTFKELGLTSKQEALFLELI